MNYTLCEILARVGWNTDNWRVDGERRAIHVGSFRKPCMRTAHHKVCGPFPSQSIYVYSVDFIAYTASSEQL